MTMTAKFIDKIDGVRVQLESLAKTARTRDEAEFATKLAGDIYAAVSQHYVRLHWNPDTEFPYGMYHDELRSR